MPCASSGTGSCRDLQRGSGRLRREREEPACAADVLLVAGLAPAQVVFQRADTAPAHEQEARDEGTHDPGDRRGARERDEEDAPPRAEVAEVVRVARVAPQ